MQRFLKKVPVFCQAIVMVATSLYAGEGAAAVKFRLSFEEGSNRYVVYMTPDSVPSPDMLLSAQVTLVVPRGENMPGFVLENIESNISGINWIEHSRVEQPEESQSADYISLGYFFTQGTPPSFNWVADKEKKVLSFESPNGCIDGAKLIDDQDPFNHLPNSVGTNPGNDFLNVGWLMSNAYIGNYGGPVSCVKPQTKCEYTPQDQRILYMIDVIEGYRENANAFLLKLIDQRVSTLKSRLSCKL
jgi:hypothetical protein